MLYKTTELRGARLDLAVALAEGYKLGTGQPRTAAGILFPLSIPGSEYLTAVGWDVATEQWGVNIRRYSSEDRHAGPIIDREKISTFPEGSGWMATVGSTVDLVIALSDTRLEAAMRMRAYQYHGSTVELPV